MKLNGQQKLCGAIFCGASLLLGVLMIFLLGERFSVDEKGVVDLICHKSYWLIGIPVPYGSYSCLRVIVLRGYPLCVGGVN